MTFIVIYPYEKKYEKEAKKPGKRNERRTPIPEIHIVCSNLEFLVRILTGLFLIPLRRKKTKKDIAGRKRNANKKTYSVWLRQRQRICLTFSLGESSEIQEVVRRNTGSSASLKATLRFRIYE